MAKLSNFHPKNGILLIKKIHLFYGKDFLLLNGITFFSYVGIIYYLIQAIQLPYYKLSGIDGKSQSELAAIGKIPWNCKGMIAVIADILPLFGRQKFYYMLFYMIVGIISCITLAVLPLHIVGKTPMIAAVFFFLFNLSSAASDLLLEAKYIQLMQKNPMINSDILSYAWFCETFGALLPSIVVGIISDHADVRLNFYIFLPFLFLPLPYLFKGGLIDDKVPREKSNRINFAVLVPQWKLVLITLLLVLASLTLILITPFVGTTGQIIYLFSSFLVLIAITFCLMDFIITRIALYQFILKTTYVNIQGSLEYYYTAEPACAPTSPQFSYTIMNTVAPLAFTIAQFIAIFVFQIVFSNWKFRHVICLLVIFSMIGGLFDTILINGWNRIIFIPDEVVFICGYATISQVIKMISQLTSTYLISKLCPLGFEATMFSLLVGFGHYGFTTAAYIGVYLMDIFHIQSIRIPEENVECDFSNLNYLILVGHILLPLISLPCVYFLLPNTKLNEPIKFKEVYSV